MRYSRWGAQGSREGGSAGHKRRAGSVSDRSTTRERLEVSRRSCSRITRTIPVPEERKNVENGRKTVQSFDGFADAIYVFLVSGGRCPRGASESSPPGGTIQSQASASSILDKAKPV